MGFNYDTWGSSWGTSWGNSWGVQSGPTPVDDAVKTGTGGIDPSTGKRNIFKPTGLLERPRKKGKVEDRVDDSRQIQAEIAGRLAKEFTEPAPVVQPPVVTMTLQQIDAEIGVLLRKKLRTEEDEIAILLLLAAAA